MPVQYNDFFRQRFKMFFYFVAVLFSLVSLFGLVYDWALPHAMCELCLLGRMWMLVVVAFSCLGVCAVACRAWLFACLGPLLVAGGVGSYWQYVLYKAHFLSEYCSFSPGPHYIPKWLFLLFEQVYRFAPCESAMLVFFGYSFPVWACFLYGFTLVGYFAVLFAKPLNDKVQALHTRRLAT
tara:strand:+ start:3816 stop:4358 length:543 start_codon:yes stop_codon:yes gene_type:complete